MIFRVSFYRAFFLAVSTLTRLPSPELRGVTPTDMVVSTLFYPIVGTVLGGVLGLFGMGACLIGVPAALAATLVLLAAALATGALHEDGLADAADGLGGGRDKDKALEIMRDSRVGSYGVVALLLVTQLRFVALLTMDPRAWAVAMAHAFAVSRLGAVYLMAALPPARSEDRSLASRMILDTGWIHFTGALCVGTALSVGLAEVEGIAILATGLAAAALTGLYYRRRLGGTTGDLIGATTLGVEALALLAWTLFHPSALSPWFSQAYFGPST